MRGPGLVLAAALCGVALTACRDEAVQSPTAEKGGASKEAGVPSARGYTGYTIRARIHPSLPEYAFTLRGAQADPAQESIRVTSIEIRAGSAANPSQVITALETETPLVAGMPVLEPIDMNFDGYQDMRIVEFRSAGPNTAYLNWLFDPVTGNFVQNKDLNEIPSAQFDPVRREIRSEWRDGATRYGTSIYAFRDGRPILVRKEEKTFRSADVYVLTVSGLVDGAWRTIERREVREAAKPNTASSQEMVK